MLIQDPLGFSMQSLSADHFLFHSSVHKFIPDCVLWCPVDGIKYGLGIIEIDSVLESPSAVDTQNAIRQCACYALTIMAHSYSCFRDLRNEPLVALLISPKRLYRLTFWKLKKGERFYSSVGWYFKIETTSDVSQIVRVMINYVDHCDRIRKIARQCAVSASDPLWWSPLNLGDCDLQPLGCSHFGFLFRSSPAAVRKIYQEFKWGKYPRDFFESPDSHSFDNERTVILKFLSPILHVNALVFYLSVESFLSRLSLDRSNEYLVKHPYLCLLSLPRTHFCFVMKDVGRNLDDLLHESDGKFQKEWKLNSQVRRKFLNEVSSILYLFKSGKFSL
jgi:hypothetical protein